MTALSRPTRFDALVVGARCAGAATAMLLARAGLKTLVVDRDGPGTDTMSTHALMRGAVMQLDRWGLLNGLVDTGTPEIRKTTFFYGSEPVPLDIRPSHGVDFLLAPRRSLLDATLTDAAREAGATVRHRTSLRDLVRDDAGRVTGAVLSGPDGKAYHVDAGIVIGADGRRSTVARRVAARTLAESRHSTACLYAYVDGMQEDGYRWYFNTDVSAGAIPTNDGGHCVFAAVREAEFRQIRTGRDPKELLIALCRRANGAFGAELAQTNASSRPVIFGGARGHIRQSQGQGWALVGDAGYFKDPATAHGITDALRDAEILVNTIISTPDRLAGYQAQRDGISRNLFEITDRIASFDWSLRELQGLHHGLNKTMKVEQTWMLESFAEPAAAA